MQRKHLFWNAFLLGFYSYGVAASENNGLPHGISVVFKNESANSIDALLDEYFQKDSQLKKKDRQDLSIRDADIAVHMFQLGPQGQTFFPDLVMKTGDNCEKTKALEFATRLERDSDQQLKISEVSMMVGPSYTFKERVVIDPKTKKPLLDPVTGKAVKRLNLTEVIIGQLGVQSLDAGAMSLSFSNPRFKELVSSGRIKIHPQMDPQSGRIQSYQIQQMKDGKVEKAYSYTPNIDRSASVEAKDPETNTPTGGILMPHAVYFAPRDSGLLESKTWQMGMPTGTAIHGADTAHITARSSVNQGSAGCARVQNDFAQHTYMAIRRHLEKNGAQPELNGAGVNITEEDVVDANGKLVKQNIHQTQANAANLKAMLQSRQKISMSGFVPVSAAEMSVHFEKQLQEQWQKIFSGSVNTAKMGEVGKVLDYYFQQKELIETKIADYNSRPDRVFFFKNKKKQNIGNEIQSIRSELPQLQEEVMTRIEELEKTPRAELDPEVQKLVALSLKVREYRKKDTDDLNKGKESAPIYDMDEDSKAFYASSQNQADLYEKSADAMSRYYQKRFGTNVPMACRQHVAHYRSVAAKIRQGGGAD